MKTALHNPIEHFFQCPYCWQNISFVIEPTNDSQDYIEDCEVCCRPIKVNFSLNEDGDLEFYSESIHS